MRHILAVMVLALAGSALGQSSAWDYTTKTDISGKVTEFAMSSSLVVRCASKCEVFFTPDKYTLVEDQGSAFVKFNDKPATRKSPTLIFSQIPVPVFQARISLEREKKPNCGNTEQEQPDLHRNHRDV